MRAVTWICRLGLVTLAAALLFAAVFVAVGPRLWGVANGWSGTPIELPGFEELARPSVAMAADGTTVLARFERENSQPIELADVPQNVVDAFLAVEDREFFRHNGLNARALFRATVSNVASDAAEQGASTITMQVAKNEFLGGMDRDLRYKVLQIHYALMLERRYSKEEILERYLNTVFFGNQAYGIEAAAETYFGKHARDLQPIEAAFLAGLVQSPSAYDPIDNPGRARNRFEQVVGQLVEQGNLTQDEAEAYLDRDTGFQIPVRTQSFPDAAPVARSYFSDALTDFLLNRSEILGTTYAERFAALYRGGLRIETTLNPTYQRLAEQAGNVLPENQQGFEAAILSLDTRTGAVVAMVGGRNYQESQVNMTLRTRQTGSSVKLFILAAAMQAGVQDTDIINGTRPCTLPNPDNPNEPFEITDAVNGGIDTIRSMTARSINCAFGRLSQIVGLHRVVDSMYRMASSAWLYAGANPCATCTAPERVPLQPYASLATGANEMSPLDMASGAQTIANNGLHMQPYLVQSITREATGEVIYQHEDPGTQVLDPGVALRTVDVLKDVLEYGTGRRFPLSVPAAGKTGTQENNTNAWFVGFTPNLTTAVWVGDPDNYTPMVNVPEFDQGRVQGGLYPAEIWQAFMEPASQFEGGEDWAAPPANTREPSRLFLPGEECPWVITGYETVVVTPGGTVPPVDPNAPADPNAPPVTAAPAVTQQRPNFGPIDGGTTIPPDNLDPLWPVPSFPVSYGYEYRQC